MKKTCVSFVILALSCVSVCAADFYVDALADAASGTGAEQAPFAKIKDAVAAANELVDESSTVFVRGGDDRVYAIDGADDLITVSVSNLTITAWGDFGKPHVVLNEDLSASTPSPVAINIAKGANFCRIEKLKFTYYNTANKNNENRAGKSLGADGKVIFIMGDDVVVDSCVFVQNGRGGNYIPDYGSCGVVVSGSEQGTVNKDGLRMVVKNCLFEGMRQLGRYAVHVGNNAVVSGNVFTNCQRLVYATKQSSSLLFASNRVVSCEQGFRSQTSGWNEIANAVLAFNVFVDTTEPFLLKSRRGMQGTPKIYNNTFIGSKEFIRVENLNETTWTAQIFNNLIVITNNESMALSEIGTAFPGNQKSSFTAGSFFRNNAYYSSALLGGTGTELEGYEAGLTFTDNIALAALPVFVSTDPSSPDFCRPTQADNPSFAIKSFAWTNDGQYPAFIGALEPKPAGGFYIIFR